MLEQALHAGVERRQVVVALAGDEHFRTQLLEPPDQVLAEEPRTPGDGHALVGPVSLHWCISREVEDVLVGLFGSSGELGAPYSFPRSAWECRLRRSASAEPRTAAEWPRSRRPRVERRETRFPGRKRV